MLEQYRFNPELHYSKNGYLFIIIRGTCRKEHQMKIQISSNAAAWYKQELGLNTGDFVRFYARYGGYSTVQSGFSLGIAVDEPMELAVKTVEDGITFYIEEKDLWYFDEHDLIIELDSKRQEPAIQYQKNL
jgi:uncharacterized protein YneR